MSDDDNSNKAASVPKTQSSYVDRIIRVQAFIRANLDADRLIWTVLLRRRVIRAFIGIGYTVP